MAQELVPVVRVGDYTTVDSSVNGLALIHIEDKVVAHQEKKG
jgi:hypothetical protein